MSLQILPAAPMHKVAIQAIIPRLTEFGVPAWRDAAAIERATQEALEKWFANPAPEATVLVAVDGIELLGFIHVETEPDFFDGTKRGYVSSIAVSQNAQGQGVGKGLLEAAEDWARAQGFDYLALTVFADNARATEFYQRLGYLEDSTKLYKPLQ